MISLALKNKFYIFGKTLKKIKMKNLLRSITLIVVSFLAFSCSEPEQDEQNLKPTSITKLLGAAKQDFSYFSEALEITGMDAMLDEPGEYTVFAPTDDALYVVLGGLTVEEFDIANPGVLESVLKHHIVNAKALSTDLTDGQAVTTSLGQTITVDIEDNTYYPEIDPDLGTYEQKTIFINSSRVFARDAAASNGVIHVIDAVLMPTIGG